MATTAADAQLCIDTIRTLAIDADPGGQQRPPRPAAGDGAGRVPALRGGHEAQPARPATGRTATASSSRAGHGSMLLYAALHLSGYDLPLDELKHFRQWGSLTPGHPERDRVHVTPGVEVTTGPLGQGFANGVGMAMAERFLRERYGAEVQDHHVYAIVSDGDLMEGVASEAASLAGQLGLGRLVYLYDDNDVTLDGPASLRFTARGPRASASRPTAGTRCASRTPTTSTRCAPRSTPAQAEQDRPTLISVKSIIGYPSPQQGTSEVHGKALGEENVRASPRRRSAGIPTRRSTSPTASTRRSRPSAASARTRSGSERFEACRAEQPRAAPRSGTPRGRAGRWRRSPRCCRRSRSATKRRDARRRRQGHGRVRAAGPDDGRRRRRPLRVDEDRSSRSPSSYTREARRAQRVLRRARARHGRAVNGMAAHGGIVRPYGSTFLQFADYMRGVDPPVGAHGPAGRVGVHARLGRARRGRPDAPAGRAPSWRCARSPA